MKNTTKALKKGFSLVEMLVVIAVIGIIAAIAVPNIGKINERAKEAKNMRNAQNLASVYAAAAAAGYDFAYNNGDSSSGTARDKNATIAAIVAGDTINDNTNPFNGTYFGVRGLKAADQTEAAAFLDMTANSELIYQGPGEF